MEFRFLFDNASDFLVRNPAVASAIKAQPGEVSFLVRSWARARARENGVEFADEDDSFDDDEYEHPPVLLRPVDNSDDEPPWDVPTMQLNEQDDTAYQSSDSSSTFSEYTTTTEYSSDGGFVVNIGAQDVFLHNHDPDFSPDNVSTSDVSGDNEAGQEADDVQNDDDVSAYDKANVSEDEGTDDDEGPPTAKISRRDSAGF